MRCILECHLHRCRRGASDSWWCQITYLCRYNICNIGPRQDPWGTPQVNKNWSERVLLIKIWWDLPERYDFSQSKALPHILKLICKYCSRRAWSTVSKGLVVVTEWQIDHSYLVECRSRSLERLFPCYVASIIRLVSGIEVINSHEHEVRRLQLFAVGFDIKDKLRTSLLIL